MTSRTPNLFTTDLKLKEHLRSFDGHLIISPLIIDKDREFFRDKKSMQWYPTLHKHEYREVDPVFLFQACALWGDRVFDPKFQELHQLLDQEPYTRFYGKKAVGDLYPRSYRGAIPLDSESLCEIASQSGISLVLHSSRHNNDGIPSSRIFEATAASTVIISDENRFVQENFGDSVLYIDTKQDAQSILAQIREHMQWIRDHKAEALQKAKQAYEIFTERFLLEDQLLRLEKFHESKDNTSGCN